MGKIKIRSGFSLIELLITLVILGFVVLPASYVYRNTVKVWMLNKSSLQIKRTVREAMDYINKDLTAAEAASVMAVGPAVCDAMELVPDPFEGEESSDSCTAVYNALAQDRAVDIETHPLLNPGLEQTRPQTTPGKDVPCGWRTSGFRYKQAAEIGEWLKNWIVWFGKWAVSWIPGVDAGDTPKLTWNENYFPITTPLVSYCTKEGNRAVYVSYKNSGAGYYFSLPFYIPHPDKEYILTGYYRAVLGNLRDSVQADLQDLGEKAYAALAGWVINWIGNLRIKDVSCGVDLVLRDGRSELGVYSYPIQEHDFIYQGALNTWLWGAEREKSNWEALDPVTFTPRNKHIWADTPVRLRCFLRFELDREDYEASLTNRILMAVVDFVKDLMGDSKTKGILRLDGCNGDAYFDCISVARKEVKLMDVPADRELTEDELEYFLSERVTFQTKDRGGLTTAYRYRIKDASYRYEGKDVRNYQLWREKHDGSKWVPAGYNPIAEYVTYFKVDNDAQQKFTVTLECQRENPNEPGEWLSSGRQVVMIKPIIPSRW